MKQPLALSYSQNHLLSLGDVVRQELPIPKILRIPELTRRFSKIPIHDFQSFGSQPLRTPWPFLVLQATETSCFETPDPPLDGRRIMTELLAYFITGHALGNKQDPVQTVIISRFFGTKDFVPQGDFHNLSIANLQTSHLGIPP
jgi:hypothetical protein